MSFVRNSSQQLTIMDSCLSLSARQKRFMENSWAVYFSENIFPAIDEEPFAVLYSNKASRPNTPVNVIIGALLLKEFHGLSDDGILNALIFDPRFQYALHTTSFAEQPLSDRTLGRFRERCHQYREETGIDLIQNAIESVSEQMATMMKLDGSLRRMDSAMISANIKRMNRLELLYTCVSNLVKEIFRKYDGHPESFPEELRHYAEKDDRNRVIYHNRSEDTDLRIQTILDDARTLKKYCGSDYDESSNYLLLMRVLREQAVENSDGSMRLREKGEGMNAGILQNPSDPEATFRDKAGKKNVGYVANMMETVGENGASIITNYQFEQNTYSDSQFMKDTIEKMGSQEKKTTITSDGAYASAENTKLAKENNITLIHTNLTGKESPDILADFEFNENGTRVLKCAGGFEPKSCCYTAKNGQCVASFQREQCEGCPYFDQCKPKVNKRTCRKTVSFKGKQRAEQQQFRNSNEFRKMTKIRNGVESLPSILRRKYNVDHIPARGKTRKSIFFGFKVGALNLAKFCRYKQQEAKCAQLSTIG